MNLPLSLGPPPTTSFGVRTRNCGESEDQRSGSGPLKTVCGFNVVKKLKMVLTNVQKRIRGVKNCQVGVGWKEDLRYLASIAKEVSPFDWTGQASAVRSDFEYEKEESRVRSNWSCRRCQQGD
eukprot:GHVP01002182.1.p1 GENE.GHVP01002182.1~~GHVP01002182.1.p1  ORF type:complete len:123 (-),score=12.84 GHVP01002182.1:154-522(-)